MVASIKSLAKTATLLNWEVEAFESDGLGEDGDKIVYLQVQLSTLDGGDLDTRSVEIQAVRASDGSLSIVGVNS